MDLGPGDGRTPVDFNREIKPGPLEVGFDSAFFIPAEPAGSGILTAACFALTWNVSAIARVSTPRPADGAAISRATGGRELGGRR